jgi:hypothetical protein
MAAAVGQFQASRLPFVSECPHECLTVPGY